VRKVGGQRQDVASGSPDPFSEGRATLRRSGYRLTGDRYPGLGQLAGKSSRQPDPPAPLLHEVPTPEPTRYRARSTHVPSPESNMNLG
jgi:hypothetical protein